MGLLARSKGCLHDRLFLTGFRPDESGTEPGAEPATSSTTQPFSASTNADTPCSRPALRTGLLSTFGAVRGARADANALPVSTLGFDPHDPFDERPTNQYQHAWAPWMTRRTSDSVGFALLRLADAGFAVRTGAFTRADARDTPVASSPRLGRTGTGTRGDLRPRAATGAPRPGLAARHAPAGDAQTVRTTVPKPFRV